MNNSPSDGGILTRKSESASRIFDQISEILDGNGDIPQETKDRLMLAGMRELFYIVKPISDHASRIEDLERKVILNLITRHPKLAVTLFLLFFLLFNLWFASDFRRAILPLLGFSSVLIP